MGNPRGPSKKNQGGGESDLHAAARSGDLRNVESICNSNPLAINSRDRHSRTPLHLAAWSGQTDVVRFLCKNKADVGAAAMDDTAAIHFASQKGHLEIVRILLASGVSVKAANRKGLTPLHYAAQGSHLELIKYLIKKGASLTAKTKSGQTPLDSAPTKEVRSFLLECEKSLTKGDQSTTSKMGKESVLAQSVNETNTGSDANDTVNEVDDEDSDAREKRKAEEADDESLPKPKKAKVSLEHLLTEDDAQEEVEE
ncbi:poly [ADP-ribose] polymerase tankyrase-like [Phoenix dactylifera]|uniref:Poly [ADP-ribose] polymerase tankyrase-like n=1 Tax=Phoenix dactylifera TaxID=42345 RepID=A0A8B8ZKS7_PHODC|nr:poly [ADP-ribose] polymerase tankyrase-like [Phoenix dactylifera]XP_038974806.1 poly [ADP-ribose] polymerase tankyrase-like [Phoenix dactylifera]